VITRSSNIFGWTRSVLQNFKLQRLCVENICRPAPTASSPVRCLYSVQTNQHARRKQVFTILNTSPSCAGKCYWWCADKFQRLIFYFSDWQLNRRFVNRYTGLQTGCLYKTGIPVLYRQPGIALGADALLTPFPLHHRHQHSFEPFTLRSLWFTFLLA
jgi:hypothetical protein